jgi:hypothetical protein
MDLVVKHLSEPPPPLGQFAKVPKSLEVCVMAMLAKDPNQRPSLEDVRAIMVDPSRRLTPLPTRALSQFPPAPPGSRWPVFAIATLAAAGLGVLTWKLVTDHTDSAASAVESVPVEPAGIMAQQPAPAPEPPPAPPPPVVERGTLEVSVSGAKDSTILVDGEEWGRGASLKVQLEPGEHTVTVKPPGRASISQKVVINGGAVNSIAVVVPPPQATRVIRVPKKEAKDTTKRDDDLLAPKRNR